MVQRADGGAAYGAVIVGDDGVRWQAVAPSRSELLRRLGDYVATHAEHQLWPADAVRVTRWLALGDVERAVAHYFASVGERWDRERLHWTGPTEWAVDVRTIDRRGRA